MPRHANRVVLATAALVAAALLFYSQTRAFAWDEGFHLLTAQLIDRGRRPYLDFVFSQTPLNAYWNALWMHLFGETWRTAHAVAALMTALAALLTAGHLLRRFPDPAFRLAASVTAIFLIALNIAVFQFGTIGQAYAFCLVLIVTAYRAATAAVERPHLLLAALAGFCACAAANASLLTAPVAPVLFLWLLIANRDGRRIAKLAAFLAGGVLAFTPLAWLYVQGPKQTVFNVLQYNLLYRQRHWDNALQHNIDQWTAWIDSPQALVLGALAIAGLLYARRQPTWDRAWRREAYLCACLSIALIAHISTALPTFTRYYLLPVPFLTILAATGLYALHQRFAPATRPRWTAAAVCLLSVLTLARALYMGRDDFSWSDAESIAAKVQSVTPPQALLLADEPIYVITRHNPAPGMELGDSHKLDFPPAQAAELHVVPQAELNRRLKAGVYDVVEVSDDDERLDRQVLSHLYAHNEAVENAHVYWDKRK